MSPVFLEVVQKGGLTIGCLLLVVAALHDLATRTVPNWIPVGILGAGCVMRAVAGELKWGVLAVLIVFALMFVCWLRGWMGGGDIKLLVAVAMLVPPPAVLGQMLMISLAGAPLIFVYALLRLVVSPPRPSVQRPARLLQRLVRVERWRIQRFRSFPYATAIAVGTFFILFAV